MTMYSHLSKRIRAISFPPRYQNLALLTPLLFSSLSTKTQTPPQKEKKLPFIAQYLISSFGFSPDRALKYSANSHLAPIKSPARPEAVIKFLSDTGLTDAQIKAVVSFLPNLLGYNVDKTLKPKVRELIDGGCSPQLLVQLIRFNPHALSLNNNISRLQFWRNFVGNDDQALLRIIKSNGLLMICSIDKHILPRMDLLKEYGMSNPDILFLLQQRSRCMSRNLNALRKELELIDGLGIPRGSKKFRTAVTAIGALNEQKIKNNVEFLKQSYGWSQEDVNSAIRKHPTILAYSETKVKSNMGFLLGKAGFEPRSLASNPMLIGVSLERVLIPRYNVLHALEAKGLKIKCSLSTAFMMSERSFHKRYVVPFEKDFPGIGQVYVAAKGLTEA